MPATERGATVPAGDMKRSMCVRWNVPRILPRMSNTLTMTTGDAAAPASERRRVLGLTVVHHTEPRHVGRTTSLGARVALELGRESTLFGAAVLDEQRISRRHARLDVGDELAATVEDLGSRNGTFVNGRRVERATVGPGDLLGLGGVLLRVSTFPATAFPEPRHPRLLGTSPELAHLLHEIDLVAPRSAPVMVLGETGVGKELVAREIHRGSGRRGELVGLNCGGVTDSVLQAELFGHARGAYTGADRARPGLVETASGGTLFLDEIGDASPALQVSLLRLLQEGEYRPVGADRSQKSDARIVAATHRPLAALVETGAFRQDLWMRLSRWVVTVPPLRERLGDVPLLAAAFAERHAGRPMRLSRAFVEGLLRRTWPGNVRELDGVIERAVALAEGDELVALPEAPAPPPEAAAPAPAPSPRSGRYSGARPTAAELEDALRAHGGNVTRVAAQFGCGRNTLYRWLREAGIDPVSGR